MPTTILWLKCRYFSMQQYWPSHYLNPMSNSIYHSFHMERNVLYLLLRIYKGSSENPVITDFLMRSESRVKVNFWLSWESWNRKYQPFRLMLWQHEGQVWRPGWSSFDNCVPSPLQYFSCLPLWLFMLSSQTEPTEAYKTGHRDSKNSEKSALLLSTWWC